MRFARQKGFFLSSPGFIPVDLLCPWIHHAKPSADRGGNFNHHNVAGPFGSDEEAALGAEMCEAGVRVFGRRGRRG